MIFTLIVMIGTIVLHALLVDSIARIGNAILSVLMAFNYVTLLVVAVDYVILLTVDPVDPRVSGKGWV